MTAEALGRLMARLVMQPHQLIGAERERCVCSARVVTELHFVHSWCKTLNNGADLSSNQPFLRDLFEYCNH